MARLKVLSIDGGGTRGLVPATILRMLSDDLGKQPAELFDLIAGTSAGGIITAGMAAQVPIATIQGLFLSEAAAIFDPRMAVPLERAKFSNATLKERLKDIFGDKTLRDAHVAYNANGTLAKVFMITSFRLDPLDGGKPANYRSEVFTSSSIWSADERLSDLALRTSAAPTYFPIYQGYVDGGVAMNNPSMAAIAFALNDNKAAAPYRLDGSPLKGLGQMASQLKVLSLGTGTSNHSRIETDIDFGTDWGILEWAARLPNMLIEANVQSTNYYVQQVLPADAYCRIQLYFDNQTHDNKWTHATENYVAPPNAIVNKELAMDITDIPTLTYLKDYAEAYYTANRDALVRFVTED